MYGQRFFRFIEPTCIGVAFTIGYLDLIHRNQGVQKDAGSLSVHSTRDNHLAVERPGGEIQIDFQIVKARH